jgi:hypothetical protein
MNPVNNPATSPTAKPVMQTDDLIRGLAADMTASRTSLERLFLFAFLPGLVVALALFALLLGPRPDFAAMLGDWRFIFKFAVTLSLGLCAALLVWRLVRPGAPARAQSLALGLVALLALAGVGAEMIAVPRPLWGLYLVGQNSIVCLLSIPLFALPILIAALAALRRGAPTRPGIAGAVAGLFAGGVGGAIYAAHCPDDSPLFVTAWYGLAIAGIAVAGGIAGRLSLRW